MHSGKNLEGMKGDEEPAIIARDRIKGRIRSMKKKNPLFRTDVLALRSGEDLDVSSLL